LNVIRTRHHTTTSKTQLPQKLNFRNTCGGVDTAASDIRNGDIAAMNREFRLEQEQRRREYDE